jgi:hypothetical protein
MDVPACCPHCDTACVWDVELKVERELAWEHPHGPAFPFRCPHCERVLRITFDWQVERGADPRSLRVVAATARPPEPAILLVHPCPHGCGARLGLQLRADDPWAAQPLWPDDPSILGGYRCPTCDAECVLRLRPVVGS